MLDRLVAFKQKNGRYPTHTDFRHGNITPSKNVYYRNFEKMENAIEEAKHYENGDLILDEQKLKQPKKFKPTEGSFQCPFCGSWAKKSEEYYSSLTTILISRFLKLLSSHDGDTHSNGVLDCIYAVFGNENPSVRKALTSAGYLEKFQERFSEES